ncbi:MAG TPA: NYN domain-containing protein [Gaiellaceae bacterium]|nr:NYN domain-containing protein [Gaiellaceae bacterium]
MLYLFDGYNLLHAGSFRSRDELVDRLAGFVGLHGARGVVVFDGVGDDTTVGSLDVRFAHPADELIERLAAEHRAAERVVLVSSDREIRRTAGQEVAKRTSKDFATELTAEDATRRVREPRARVEDALDDDIRARLEEWRRRRP